MPELPEVETVRRGLAEHVVGRRLTAVTVTHPRAVRRHVGGATDLASRLAGKTVTAARRRGKYLWLDVVDADDDAALVVHLGMSGQMLIGGRDTTDPVHLRIRAGLDDGNHLRFVDQRTFGGWHLDDHVDDPFGGVAAVPSSIAHIAPDPFEDVFDRDAAIAAVRARGTEIKRVLLDQTIISGIGNIYADEALWAARLHGARTAARLPRKRVAELIDAATSVMGSALAVGGTSFDALYVNVNGQSGYFDRRLEVYGREGEPCRRCGSTIKRVVFMNRSSHFCPVCQRKR
ncbi:MAG: bifunctional DNA-formamidopyrimidine glycosylase/DNA-(apurinic or apyrimidinic site) lyase [Gordonia sp. (in: high G+C Gram-positive bacteria)]